MNRESSAHAESGATLVEAATRTRKFLAAMASSMDSERIGEGDVSFHGSGNLPSVFPVSDFAAAAVGTAGIAVADFMAAVFGASSRVDVDRRLASWADANENTDFGTVRRLRSPIVIGSAFLRWDRPASKLGTAAPIW